MVSDPRIRQRRPRTAMEPDSTATVHLGPRTRVLSLMEDSGKSVAAITQAQANETMARSAITRGMERATITDAILKGRQQFEGVQRSIDTAELMQQLEQNAAIAGSSLVEAGGHLNNKAFTIVEDESARHVTKQVEKKGKTQSAEPYRKEAEAMAAFAEQQAQLRQHGTEATLPSSSLNAPPKADIHEAQDLMTLEAKLEVTNALPIAMPAAKEDHVRSKDDTEVPSSALLETIEAGHDSGDTLESFKDDGNGKKSSDNGFFTAVTSGISRMLGIA